MRIILQSSQSELVPELIIHRIWCNHGCPEGRRIHNLKSQEALYFINGLRVTEDEFLSSGTLKISSVGATEKERSVTRYPTIPQFPVTDRLCLNCGNPIKGRQVYCSVKCRMRAFLERGRAA